MEGEQSRDMGIDYKQVAADMSHLNDLTQVERNFGAVDLMQSEDGDDTNNPDKENGSCCGAKKDPAANQGPAANATPGVKVYHNLTFGGNWSFPGLGIHLYPNQPLSIQQHEYGHYLQYKQMNIVSYTWYVAIPSSINLALINGGVHTNDHDMQIYELEATTLADHFYGKNSKVGGPDSPTFRDYPELAPKS
jgi:hypothetical protein